MMNGTCERDQGKGNTMYSEIVDGPVLNWQRRQGGVQFYFCCCPLLLPLAPLFLVARLAQYGMLRLLGRPAASPWARRA